MTIFILFVLGLSVGSFLNVLIDRIPHNESIWKNRSHCDYCKHILSWYDLIPVFSFLILTRKCRYCHKKISWQYPLIELITGVAFLFTYIFFLFNQLSTTNNLPAGEAGQQFQIIYHLILVSSLIAIFFADLKYRIIPDQILILLAVVTFIYLYFFQRNNLPDHLLAALIFFSIFFILVLVTRGKGMGLGDVKYAFVMGFILGMSFSVVSFYLSFLTGAVISLILIIKGKKKMKSTIPFGPFLTASTAITLFYGKNLWDIFRKIIGI